MQPHSTNQGIEGPWELIIKIIRARNRRIRRIAFAYEAINLQGLNIFSGGATCAAETPINEAT